MLRFLSSLKLSNTRLKIIKLLFFYFLSFEKDEILPSILVAYSLAIIKTNHINMSDTRGRTFSLSEIVCIKPRRVNSIMRKIKSVKDICYVDNLFVHRKIFERNKYAIKEPTKIKRKSCKNVNYVHILSKIFMVNENTDSIYNRIINSNIINKSLNDNIMYRNNYDQNLLLEISNNQIDIPIDLASFEKEVRKLLDILKFKNFQLNITFVTLKEMKSINKMHRNKNKPTDVISLLHYVKNNENENDLNYELVNSGITDRTYFNAGDIYLCPEYINRECVMSKINYERKVINGKEAENSASCAQSSTTEEVNSYNSNEGSSVGGSSDHLSNDGERNNESENKNYYDTDEEENGRGVNKLFQRIFCVNERLPFYVLHALIHLMNKDHVNSFKEYNEFMDMEEQIIEKYLKYHHYSQTFYSHHIVGIGTDILSVNRIYKILKKKNKNYFLKKVLNSLELKEFAIEEGKEQKKKREEKGGEKMEEKGKENWEEKNMRIKDGMEKLAIYVSKKFAAKEAILKSIGRGLSSISKYGLSMNDIEIKNDKYGKPHVYLYDKARKIANEMGIVKIFLSISDEKITCTDHNHTKSHVTTCNFCTYLIHAQALAVGSNV
ncbi:holo-[acyl-carrier-protein] synthase [Plasmodium brasilianum]|uniref:Holo-[acyl-carrier-protein] synthase n=1 Tax=Plasmodium brasilianum TaxID=5824 RepID=A0ACB9YEV6_PLABR|nr:holo-[acyl-carrier-protein] synthase [Plasmodium brasilianum]